MQLRCKQTQIKVEDLILKSFGQLMQDVEQSTYGKIIPIVDSNILALYPEFFKGLNCVVIPAGEESKSLKQIEILMNQLLDAGADRSTLLVGVGGGVVCDITGFAASTFMRGVDFGFVPTTLLSMVDASIGGKNGVNIGMNKNMMGTFNQPQFIIVNLNFLNTLSQIELKSGMAEVVKHACIESNAHFDFVEKHYEEILKLNPFHLKKMIVDTMAIKISIVEKDEQELGIRKHLNYGHTYGHAIEKTEGLPHGYAISLGVVLANELAKKTSCLSSNEQNRVIHLLEAIGLPTDITHINKSMLKPLISHDKKKNNENIDFILLETIGKASIHSIPIDIL